MTRFLARTVVAALAVVWLAAPVVGQDRVTLSFESGRVTLVARNASLGQILAEWQRVGRTRFVNVERLPPSPVTLELTGVSERQALAVLLRPFSGYMASPSSKSTDGASSLAVVLVMPTLARVSPPPSGANVSSGFQPSAQPRLLNRGFGRPGIQVGGDPDPDMSDPGVGVDPQDQPEAVQPGMPGGAASPGMPTAPSQGQSSDPRSATPPPNRFPGYPGVPGTALVPGMVVPAPSTPGASPAKPPKPPGRPDAPPPP
ncbi:MAG: hypothetical protein AB1806_21555 [Acidobacteriota bacterium]